MPPLKIEHLSLVLCEAIAMGLVLSQERN